MPTRIAFSTHYPARMKELAGKPTRFPEKILKGIYGGYLTDETMELYTYAKCGISYNTSGISHPKTTTIRKNYDYWKSKEGQLIQPFFWAGTPYRSKHVVFCPEVRLKKVEKIEVDRELSMITIEDDDRLLFINDGYQLKYFTQHEGFDDPDHFWMWFDKEMEGALLELESVER